MRLNIYYIIVFLLLTLIFSCTKIRENKIEGSWEYVTVASWEESIDEIWTFTEQGELIINTTDNATTTTTSDTAIYYIKSEGLSGYVEIFDYDMYKDGKYRIKKLTNHQLKIIRLFDGYGNPEYILREFQR